MADEQTKPETIINNNSAKYLITFLAVGGIIALRLTGKDLNWTEIALFTIGVLPWFASFMDSFKFGKDGFEAIFKKLEEVEEITKENAEKINEVKETSEINQSIGEFGTGGGSDISTKAYRAETSEKADYPNDPQKGKWGGSPVDKKTHRKLLVTVEPISNNDYLRRVILRVESTAPSEYPLTSDVTFHLHPTFNKPVVTVKPQNNAAEIKLVAWGAFTVGAETDNGETKLEFDMAKEFANSEDPFFTR